MRTLVVLIAFAVDVSCWLEEQTSVGTSCWQAADAHIAPNRRVSVSVYHFYGYLWRVCGSMGVFGSVDVCVCVCATTTQVCVCVCLWVSEIALILNWVLCVISALNTLLTMNFMARLVKRLKNQEHTHTHTDLRIHLQVSHRYSLSLSLADGTICCALDTFHHHRAGQLRRIVRHVY